VSLRLAAGAQDDPPGLEGAAVLLAQILRDQAARTLDPATSVLTAEVHRTTTVFTLLTLPDGWAQAWRAVHSVLFQADLDPTLLDVRRSELLERLTFEAGSPILDAEREAVGVFAERGSPWARPVRGTLTSVTAIDITTLEGYRSAQYRAEAAAIAVVGPVEADTPSSTAPDSVPVGADSVASVSDSLPPTLGAGPTSPVRGETPWLVGDRVNLVRDVTSTWITIGYPVPPELQRTHLELVAHLLTEELDPVPPDPDRYDVAVRIDQTPRGSVLVIEATVFPEAADRWEERILAEVRRLAAAPIPDDFFRWRRRRFRTARLLEQAAPEAEAARMTADLLREGTVRNMDVSIWDLDAETLQAAAASLGEPRIFRYGPELGQEGARGLLR
jgi:predicted Zn-dependent peptidase